MTEYEIACLGKVRYHQRAYAKRASSRIRRTGGPNLRTYRCRFCELWHLGHRAGHATYLRRTTRGPIPLQELIP